MAIPSLVKLLYRKLLANTTLTKFLIIGSMGYLVYQSVLFAVYDSPLFPFLPDKDVGADLFFFDHGDIRLLIGTLVAMEFGIAAGFTGHHLWTFRDRGTRKPLLLRFAQFHANQLISALGILTVTVNVLTVQAGFYHFMAVPIGVALAGAWNWTWDTQFIWRRSKGGDAPS
jgi:putative flippase GtrA